VKSFFQRDFPTRWKGVKKWYQYIVSFLGIQWPPRQKLDFVKEPVNNLQLWTKYVISKRKEYYN
jgi:hypothetical protein